MLELKTIEVDGTKYAVLKDGKPLYLDGATEVAFDAPRATDKIAELVTESRTNREGKEAAETKLKKFEGIEDPAAALSALATVKNLDDKKLVDAGEIETVKAAAIEAVEAKYAPMVEENKTLKGALHKETIGGRFARSAFIQEKLAIPADMVQATFGKHFSMNDGVLEIKDDSGNPVYSKVNAGEPANFEEGLEILVSQYAHKDSIMKGSGASGSGADHGGGQNRGGQGDFGGDKTARVAAVANKFPDLPVS